MRSDRDDGSPRALDGSALVAVSSVMSSSTTPARDTFSFDGVGESPVEPGSLTSVILKHNERRGFNTLALAPNSQQRTAPDISRFPDCHTLLLVRLRSALAHQRAVDRA